MLSTRLDAERRYEQIRAQCLRAAQSRLLVRSEYAEVLLRTIDAAALEAATTWASSTKRRVDWDWTTGYRDFKFRYPKRFELAVWNGKELASLTLGRPTYHGSALRMDFIESAPDRTGELKVFPVSLFAVMTYAEVVGASEIRVMHPVNDAVKAYYEASGLLYVSGGDYLLARL